MGCHQEHSALETCPQCEFEAFVRNHYFTGKMMGAGEFATESLYHAEKMRHHNLRLHGAGTVCGLWVKQHPSPECRQRYVVVEPGSALDCCGREILVAQEEIVDVGQHPAVLQHTADNALHTLQVCVRWRECPTEDVPVLYDECGCDDTQCAPNRILESFAFDVLVDPPLGDALPAGAAVQGALVASDAHGATGFMPADAAGRIALIDPEDATRLLIVDPVHRSRQTVALGRAARAVAMSVDGARVFVVTVSSDGAPEAEVRVFNTADAVELGPVTAGTLRKLPGTDANSVLRAATTEQAAHALLVHVQSTGAIHPFAAQATHGIDDAPGAALTSAAHLSGWVVAADGSAAYAVDAAAGKVKIIDFSANPPADLGGLPAGAKPAALAAFRFDNVPMLAVASSTDKRVYLVNRSTNAVTPVDLQFTPQMLAAVGDGSTPNVWLHVLEHDGTGTYVRAVQLAPLATPGGAPRASAARLVGTGARHVVVIGAGGAQALLVPELLADGPCSEHVWRQLRGCPGCDTGDCVVLATLATYQGQAEMLDLPGAADDVAQRRTRIDNRAGRHIVASTATLQAWLECLQTQGGIPGPAGPAGADGADGTPGTNGAPGADGADGLGLDPDLPKIIDIAWQHRSQVPLLTWLLRLLSVDIDGKPISQQDVINAVKQGVASRVPLLTIYFNRPMQGIDRQTWRVRVDMPGTGVSTAGVPLFFGLYSLLGHELYGTIVEVPGPVPTPHTGESAAYAAVFVPRPEYVMRAAVVLGPSLQGAQALDLDWPTVTLTLKGEFVFAPDAGGNFTQDGVLDGENIGGRVGRNENRPPPIKGSKNPSGNLAQGGRFESWFFVRPSGDVIGDGNVPPLASGAGLTHMGTAGGEAAEMPLSPNFASPQALGGLRGVSAALARRIVEARGESGFASVSDFRTRAHISDREWDVLKNHLLIL